jgi:hypothetical protein
MTVHTAWAYDGDLRRWLVGPLEVDDDGRADVIAEPFGSYDVGSLHAVPPKARRTVAEKIAADCGVKAPAFLFDGPPDAHFSLTCGECWYVTFNPARVADRQCPECGHPETGQGIAPPAGSGLRLVVPVDAKGDPRPDQVDGEQPESAAADA